MNKDIANKVQQALHISNIYAIPRIEKVVINVGMGTYLRTSKDYSDIVENIKKISGQQPIVTFAKKSISNFKLREKTPIGVKVTLRGKRMYNFIDKLVKMILPRIRDFRGLSKKSFDPRGNYTIGLREVLVFPEVNPDDVNKIHGLEITITTTAQKKEEGYVLLKEFGFPFKKDE